MPANLENSAVATGLEKVSFHSNPEETETETEAAQLCLTLCDPIDNMNPAVPGILQARTLERVAISFSNAWKWKVTFSSPVATAEFSKFAGISSAALS